MTRVLASGIIAMAIIALATPILYSSWGPIGFARATGPTDNLSVGVNYASADTAGNSTGAGVTLAFGASISGGSSPYTATWVFGDGAIGSGLTIVHTYSTSGPSCYFGSLSVVDGIGATASASFGVNVTTTSVFSYSGNGSGASVNVTSACSGSSGSPGVLINPNSGSATPLTSTYGAPYSGVWATQNGWSPCNGARTTLSSTDASFGGLGALQFTKSVYTGSSCSSNTGEAQMAEGVWYCGTGASTPSCPTAWKSGYSSYTITATFKYATYCSGGVCADQYLTNAAADYSSGCRGHGITWSEFTLGVWDQTTASNVLFTTSGFSDGSNNSNSYSCSGGWNGLPNPGGPNIGGNTYTISGTFYANYGDAFAPRAGSVATAYSTDNSSGCYLFCNSGHAQGQIDFDDNCYIAEPSTCSTNWGLVSFTVS